MTPHFYSKVLEWSLNCVSDSSPLIIGVSGSQGIGKSTLTAYLAEQLRGRGLNALTISIDDFYWTREQQIALASQFPKNPLLQQRGYPGTHDLALGESILSQLKNLKAGERISIPSYNKSAHGGKGDRYPREQWPKVKGPLDIIILEGWMLGFSPVENPPIDLKTVNEFLSGYVRWYRFFNAFLFLDPVDSGLVVKWRVEAEEKMKARGLAGMSGEEIKKYAELFLPAYETYLPNLRKNFGRFGSSLHFRIGEDRQPI